MGSIKRAIIPLFFLVLSLSISSIEGWGKLGHSMVCKIAEVPCLPLSLAFLQSSLSRTYTQSSLSTLQNSLIMA